MGDRSSIRALQDKWIPNYPMNMILHMSSDVDRELWVSDLIDWTIHDWDRGKIGGMLYREEAEAIFYIPLSKRLLPDTVVWLPKKEGEYSVQSGYFTARKVQKELLGFEECSESNTSSMIWSRLWKLHIPNKVKILSGDSPDKSKSCQGQILKDDTC